MIQWKKLIPVICYFCSVSVAVEIPKPPEWSYWRGPNYNGISEETGWRSSWCEGGPAKCWQVSVQAGYSPLVIREDKIYTMGNQDEKDIVYCLSTETGDLIWEYSSD